jgi:CheY-like chemotaxis protein
MLAGYVLYLLRHTIPATLGRLGSVEAFGMKLSMSGQAMNAAIELARKQVGEPLEVPKQDRDRALERAYLECARLEGAEILWVDDKPSNNRNEVRMLSAFGTRITFACTTNEAVQAFERAAEQSQPFHLILSDINRAPPESERDAGLRMISRLREQKVFLPVILYVARLDAEAGIPAGVFGITNRCASSKSRLPRKCWRIAPVGHRLAKCLGSAATSLKLPRQWSDGAGRGARVFARRSVSRCLCRGGRRPGATH